MTGAGIPQAVCMAAAGRREVHTTPADFAEEPAARCSCERMDYFDILTVLLVVLAVAGIVWVHFGR